MPATSLTSSCEGASFDSTSVMHTLVTSDIPKHLMPQCTATVTSGQVDIPTTSAPHTCSILISAAVSNDGPQTMAYTPSLTSSASPSSLAPARARARSSLEYAWFIGGNRVPKSPSFGPRSGWFPLIPGRLMWSDMIIRSPILKDELMPPAALVTTMWVTPMCLSTRTGSVAFHSGCPSYMCTRPCMATTHLPAYRPKTSCPLWPDTVLTAKLGMSL
mmetsp:Transcript_816/g.2380  ORF Transcript_816/g.2380 Transcript_816/m.2380 type:complete len:217 (+) Transcript_816:559-1209(+)